MVEVRLMPDAAVELVALNEPIHTRIHRLLERLQNWPAVSGAKPLWEAWPDTRECGPAITEFSFMSLGQS